MRRKLIVVFATLVMLGLGAGVAYASIPGPGGVVNGCYKNATGMLIVIDSAASCSSGYTALNWNQTGPQGPAGPAGPAGPQGPPGLSGVHVVVSPTIPDSNPHETDCPSGEVALSVVFNQVNPGVFDQWVSAVPVEDVDGHPVGYQYQSDNAAVYKANVTCAVAAS